MFREQKISRTKYFFGRRTSTPTLT